MKKKLKENSQHFRHNKNSSDLFEVAEKLCKCYKTLFEEVCKHNHIVKVSLL